uniref:Uncharacterized protein n=1 Tax=Fibrocapsa japonica TaxID=94617 RepID=A0A7S2V5Z3_9STRA
MVFSRFLALIPMIVALVGGKLFEGIQGADALDVQQPQVPGFELQGEDFDSKLEYQLVFEHKKTKEEVGVPALYVDSTRLMAENPGPDYEFSKLLAFETEDDFGIEGEFDAGTYYEVIFQHKSNVEDQVAVPATYLDSTKLTTKIPGPDYEFTGVVASDEADGVEEEAFQADTEYTYEIDGEGYEADIQYEVVFAHKSNAEDQIAVPAIYVNSKLLTATCSSPDYEFVELFAVSDE